MDVSARVESIAPVDRIEVYFNGAVIEKAPRVALQKRIAVTHSGWLTLRAINEKSQFPIDDGYVVGETSPVYVYCGDRPIRSREDAEYFVRWIDDITRQAEAHPGWRSGKERRHVLDQFAEARRLFEQRAKEAKP